MPGLSYPETWQRSSFVRTSCRTKASKYRAVWAFTADRCLGRPCWGRRDGSCPRLVYATTNGNWRQATGFSELAGRARHAPLRKSVAAASATFTITTATATSSALREARTGAGDQPSTSAEYASALASPADPDAVLGGFVAAFGLPRQQLRMVLERQPALQRADPQILAQRIEAYTRATGLDAYQLLYMAARQPTFLRLPPAALKERCEALAKSLALGFEDVLPLLVSQPAFLEVQPDSLRAVSGRVAGELGVRPGAALRVLSRLPPGELLGVFARQQPGVMRERLAALRRLLMRTFGPRRATPEAALLLVTRCPPLLAMPTKFVSASLAALMSIPPTKDGGAAAGGGGRRSSVLRAILSCPHILTLPPETLRGRFVMLATATRIDMPAVVSMLLLQPRLLLADPARVRQRLEGLTFSLMVPRSAALDMVVRQPQLLLYNTETLAENWAGLQQLLGITSDSALSIVTRHPNLLCLSQTVLASKLTCLETTFALPRPRAVLLAVEKPVLLTMSEESYPTAYRVLAPLLALPSPAHLGRLICREPYLLLESSVKLTAKVSLAASLLGITEAEVGAILARSPTFIKKELSYWQTNLDTVTGSLGVSLERAREVAVRYPYLLSAEPTELLKVAAANVALVRSSPQWMALLDRADADSLFKCLAGFNDRNREHLQYLVDSGLQAEVSFLSPVIWDRAAFAQRFPRFADWQATRRATTNARNGLPLPRAAPIWPPAMAAAAAAAAVSSQSAASTNERLDDEREHAEGEAASKAEEAWDADGEYAELTTSGVRSTASTVGTLARAGRLGGDGAGQGRPPGDLQGQQLTDFTSRVAALTDPTKSSNKSTGVGSGGGGGQGPRPVAPVGRRVPRRRQVRRMPSFSSSDEEPSPQPQPQQQVERSG